MPLAARVVMGKINQPEPFESLAELGADRAAGLP
jgi:hypothetical protein